MWSHASWISRRDYRTPSPTFIILCECSMENAAWITTQKQLAALFLLTLNLSRPVSLPTPAIFLSRQIRTAVLELSGGMAVPRLGYFSGWRSDGYDGWAAPTRPFPSWARRLGFQLCHGCALFPTETSPFALGALSNLLEAVNVALENVWERSLCLRDPGSAESRRRSCQD